MGWLGNLRSKGRNFPGLPWIFEKTSLLSLWMILIPPGSIRGRHQPGSSLQGTERSRGKHPVPIQPQKYLCHSCKAATGEGTHSMKAGSSRVCCAWC